MTEVLSGEALTGTLSADHHASVYFMMQVHDVLLPAYAAWKASHDWSEVEVPDSTDIPPLWRSLREPSTQIADYRNVEADTELYQAACQEFGMDESAFSRLMQKGLDVALFNAGHSQLFGCTSDGLAFEDEHNIHYAASSLFASQGLVHEEHAGYGTNMGEVTITNVGEGDSDGYRKLQTARLRTQKLVSTIFRDPLETMRAACPEETKGLSRALAEDSDDPGYNPLLHTAIEGMMSVGQTVNALVQPGIEGTGSLPVVDVAKTVLTHQLPFIMSKITVNGDLGPEQMAGLAIDRLATASPAGVNLRPGVIQAYRTRKAGRTARTAHIEGVELLFMQQPLVMAVNRGRGCPAGAAVRLMSNMLLDALETPD